MIPKVSECLIPATGDHPNMIGYMVGDDDGVSTLYRTPEEAIAAWEKRQLSGKGEPSDDSA